jgi:hypothetical protein
MIPDPKDVIAAFWQSDESDCTTIATIKTAVATFGTDSIFEAINTNGIWSIAFRDGNKLDVADADVKSTQKKSGFAPNETLSANQAAIYEYCLFCFGVFVANFSKINNVSMDAALGQIDQVVNVYPNAQHPCYRYLGIPDKSVRLLNDPLGVGTTNIKDFAAEKLYLLWNCYHAVFAIDDQFDDYGQPADTGTFGDKHRKWVFFHWYGLNYWALSFIPD